MWVAWGQSSGRGGGRPRPAEASAKSERAAVLTRQTSFARAKLTSFQGTQSVARSGRYQSLKIGPPPGRRCRPTCVTDVMASPA